MVVASVQVEASFRLRLRLQSPFYVVEARLQKWEQPRKRRSAVELPVRRVHVRLVPNPRRHVQHVASLLARLGLEGSRRRRYVAIDGTPRVAVDRTPLGRGVHVHVRRAERDVEGSGQAGHVLAAPEVPRQSAVCAAAPFSEAGLPPRKKDSEVGA